MYDCLVVGNGIIGLAIAEELSRHGQRVALLGSPCDGPSASWAAAGVLPPPTTRESHDPLEQLRAMSHALYPEWCRRVEHDGQVGVEFRRCGGLYLARRAGEAASLHASVAQWRQQGVEVEQLTSKELREAEPALDSAATFRCIYRLPEECLVRPPRILKALRACLVARGVELMEPVGPPLWDTHGTRVVAASTSRGRIEAHTFCVAAGPWSPNILAPLGWDLPLEPYRGQMVLWEQRQPLLTQVVNEGPRYMFARRDGRLLAGSTVEEVGFDNRTTADGLAQLTTFASQLVPRLADVPPDRQWSGLRPGSLDGVPYVGWIHPWENLLVASGHFRSGIHLAPGTARLVRQLLADETTEVDPVAYAPQR